MRARARRTIGWRLSSTRGKSTKEGDCLVPEGPQDAGAIARSMFADPRPARPRTAEMLRQSRLLLSVQPYICPLQPAVMLLIREVMSIGFGSRIFWRRFLVSELMTTGSWLGIGTAKRLRLKAQGCRRGYPGLLNTFFPTRNGLRLPAATALRLTRPFNFKPRVAAAATLGFKTQPLRGKNS